MKNLETLIQESAKRNCLVYNTYEGIDDAARKNIINDLEILEKRKKEFAKRDGVRVGDYIVRLDGKVSRATHHWGDSVQDGGGAGSFHMSKSGFTSYSGGLDPAIEVERLVDTGRTRKGLIWFFSNDWAKAHNGVYYYIDFKVFREVEV